MAEAFDPWDEHQAEAAAHAANEAWLTACRKISKGRRRMSLEDAEDVMRLEHRKAGATMPDDIARNLALMVYRHPIYWFLHPRQARRNGYYIFRPPSE